MLWFGLGPSTWSTPQRVRAAPQDVGISRFFQVWQGDTISFNYERILPLGYWGTTFDSSSLGPQWADSFLGFQLLADGFECSVQLGEWFNSFHEAWRCKGRDLSSWRSHGTLHFRLSSRWTFKVASVARIFKWSWLEMPSSGVRSELSNSWS